MAAAAPVIASDIEGFAYVVGHQAEGLLVPRRDTGALADALLQLLGDPDRRQEMSRKGQIKAQSFDWPRISQQVLSFYQRVAEEKGALAPESR
jgi:phosphatidylinositol alpha-mannosyltransferase